MIHPVAPGIVTRLRMREVRLVATRNHHGGAISRTNIGKRHNHIELATTKYPVVIVIGTSQRTTVATRVYRVVATAAPYREDALIDEQSSNIAIFLAAIVAQVLDVAGMIDQL